jgi:hypothetical protein
MKVKMGMHVLAVLAVLGLSVTVAHAGRGQGGGEVQVFDCHVINGQTSGRIVTLTDQFGVQENLVLGAGQVVCTVALMTTSEETQFDNVPAGFDQDHLKCYTISSKLDSPNLAVRLFDAVNGGINTEEDGELVTVRKSRHVCTFAVKIVPTP